MPHTDIIGWWALVLAIAALVLHIPLSMLAHHYLPKVEDYIASYSRERLVKRIAKLQHRLDQLNDPKYFEDVEWNFREQLFFILYFFGVGLVGQTSRLFLATGVVPGSWFWEAPVSSPLGNRIPEFTVGFFLFGVLIAGRNMAKSVALKPSRRPKLRLDIQAQINVLKVKRDAF
jgi:hypothetical protein